MLHYASLMETNRYTRPKMGTSSINTPSLVGSQEGGDEEGEGDEDDGQVSN